MQVTRVRDRGVVAGVVDIISNIVSCQHATMITNDVTFTTTACRRLYCTLSIGTVTMNNETAMRGLLLLSLRARKRESQINNFASHLKI